MFLQCKKGIFYKMVARRGKCPKNHFFCIFGLLSYKYNLHQVGLEFRQLFYILVHPIDQAPNLFVFAPSWVSTIVVISHMSETHIKEPGICCIRPLLTWHSLCCCVCCSIVFPAMSGLVLASNISWHCTGCDSRYTCGCIRGCRT